MAITNGYATLADVKAAFRIEDAVDDDQLELAIESASRQIDGYCERVFYNAGTATRIFLPSDSFLTEIDDLISLTTLKTSADGTGFNTTWTSGDYQLEPVNGIAGGIATPYTRVRAVGSLLFPIWEPRQPDAYEATVQVTGVWGFSSVPVTIRQATIMLAQRQFKRYDAPFGIAGFGDLGAMRVGRVDPDVEALIAPYRKVSAI